MLQVTSCCSHRQTGAVHPGSLSCLPHAPGLPSQGCDATKCTLLECKQRCEHPEYQGVSGVHNVSSVQSLSCVRLVATPRPAAHQASLSITNSQSLLKLMSIKSVMPSNHLILCHPLLLPPSFFPSIRVFSKESALHIRWPKYWSFSFSISPSNEYSGLISFRINWFDLLAVHGTLKSLLHMPGGVQGPGLRKPAAQERKRDLLCTNNPPCDQCKLWDKDRAYFSPVPGTKQSLRTGLWSRRSCIISRGQGVPVPSRGRHAHTTEKTQPC